MMLQRQFSIVRGLVPFRLCEYRTINTRYIPYWQEESGPLCSHDQCNCLAREGIIGHCGFNSEKLFEYVKWHSGTRYCHEKFRRMVRLNSCTTA